MTSATFAQRYVSVWNKPAHTSWRPRHRRRPWPRSQRPFELAFVDLRLGVSSGLDLLPQLLAEDASLDVVMVTAYATFDTAVEAVQRGARDYLPKPFTPAQIRAVASRLAERRTLRARLSELEGRLAETAPEASLETASSAMQAALGLVRRAAPWRWWESWRLPPWPIWGRAASASSATTTGACWRPRG